ncbi:hypothetical protein [uncultured Senegalimassilia sp.]|uniref:hypothetical protein n=1 Tax=uncultured Senegalimassilia sp. TaxID=1714350 RepID=UPI00260CFECA|nr:hypothetical protein [uncultured Senegalimassilia sp.]
MQINIALTDNNSEQAEVLRSRWYPSANSQQIRDSFIFNEVIDRFQGDPVEVLADYFRSDDDSRTAQRRITLRQDTNERLRTIASVANKPIAATLRALIAHAVDNLAVTDAKKQAEVQTDATQVQLLNEKIAQLEKQLEACTKTLEDIKQLAR